MAWLEQSIQKQGQKIMRKSEKMIGRILGMAAVGTMVGFAIGISHASFKHYYRRFAEEEDLLSTDIIEVSIVEDKTKKSRGKK